MHASSELGIAVDFPRRDQRPRLVEGPAHDVESPELRNLVRRQLELLGENPARQSGSR